MIAVHRRFLTITVALAVAACGSTVPTSSPVPIVVPPEIPVTVATTTPTLTPTDTPATLTIISGTPEFGLADRPLIRVQVLPSLSNVEPGVVGPGEKVHIEGVGGYLELRSLDNSVTGSIETPTIFALFFDDELIGAIGCAGRSCRGTLTVPQETAPGRHEISVDGGSSLSLTVVEATPAFGFKGTEAPVFFGLRISSFPSEDVIPVRYTCDGEDVSPGLSWTTVPPGTETFLIVVDDPDAPVGTWTHWVVFNIPGDSLGLDENQPKSSELPNGGVQGRNSWGDVGYGGPCPPKSSTHGYRFFLYAVDTSFDLPPGASRSQVSDALAGHIVAEHWITRTYGR